MLTTEILQAFIRLVDETAEEHLKSGDPMSEDAQYQMLVDLINAHMEGEAKE